MAVVKVIYSFNNSFCLLLKSFYLFIYFWRTGSLLLCGLSLAVASEASSLAVMQGLLSVVASLCGGFSCCGAQALEHMQFGSCGMWAP